MVAVVARAACHGVVTRATVQCVVASTTEETVVQRIAHPGKVPHTDEAQDFHLIIQRVAHQRGTDLVGRATTGDFHHLIARIVHEVQVVACPAHHVVGTRATAEGVVAPVADECVVAVQPLEQVGPVVARQHVVGGVAGTVSGRSPQQHQVLHVVAQRVVEQR
ncbi:hypothetical protein D9M69_483540 [compost metagenome]